MVIGLIAAQPVLSKDSPDITSDELARGKRLFQNYCGRCHGMRGAGGLGPSLARVSLRHAPDQAGLMSVISNGIPGTEMPGTWAFSSADTKAVAAYVRSLGQVVQTPTMGDRFRGEAICNGKRACATCHIIRGIGGTRGPDLTDVGRRRGSDHLRRALVDPGAAHREESSEELSVWGYVRFLSVRAATLDGRGIEGVRVNEDAFTIQIRDAENRLYSLRKAELKEVRKEFGKSIMPSYGSILSDGELEDLLAYLAGLRGNE